MNTEKKELKEWIKSGKPCLYRYGLGCRGNSQPIPNELADALLKLYLYFGNDRYSVEIIHCIDGVDYLKFIELSEGDRLFINY